MRQEMLADGPGCDEISGNASSSDRCTRMWWSIQRQRAEVVEVSRR